MNLLIVCSETGTQLALERQLSARGRPFLVVSPTQLTDGVIADQEGHGEGAIVLDIASQELISRGRSQRFSEAAFRQLVDGCRQRDLPLVMVSDSRVFPGGTRPRYREADEPAPVTAAGEQLLRRERYLAEQLPRHVILRTGPVIAALGDNLLTRLVQSFRQGGAVPAAVAPKFCPTPAGDLVRVLSGMLDQIDCDVRCWGTYHYHSSDAASGYEFAEVVLAAAAQYWDVGGGHVQLQAVDATNDDAVFPLLQCQRIRDTFGIQQLPWRRAIPDLLKQIYQGENA